MTALLALAGAGAWGVGDFLGGLASRRLPVVTVLLLSQLAGLAGVLAWALATGERLPGPAEAAAAVGAGAAGLVGLAALYRGLAVGAMGIVAPISAAAPLVALAVDAVRGVTPSALQWAGVAVALAGIALVSHEPARPAGAGGRLAAGVGLALVAAVGFGLFVVGLDAAAAASVPWTIALARATSVALALAATLATRTRPAAPRSLLPLLLGVGLFDTGANVLVAQATTTGTAGVVAVLSALYPLVTIALARLVLAERVRAPQRAGGLAALAGAALVAAG